MRAKEERKWCRLWCRKKNNEQFKKDLTKRGYLPKELLYDFHDEDCKRSEKYQVKTLKAKEEGKWWKRKETHELVRNLKDAGYMMEELFALFDLTVLKEAGFEAADLKRVGKNSFLTALKLKMIKNLFENKLQHYREKEVKCVYTAKELKKAGYTIKELQDYGLLCFCLVKRGKDNVLTKEEEGDYTAKDLKIAGYKKKKLAEKLH